MDYSMTIAELLAVAGIESDDQTQITDLTLDSRKVQAGSLFFAYPGGSSDGRDYIRQAVDAGASAIIYEAEGFEAPESAALPMFAVAGLQSKIGALAHEFFQRPTEALQVFGVTGTNGKTTCCYLLTQALNKLGLDAAMIGTIGVGRLDNLDSATHTTPDPISIHRLFAGFRDQEITQVCMEVSSHALDQGRVAGVHFFCTLFTNLSHDHLDYHGDMTTYANAKRRLFTDFHSELVITNAADQTGASLIDMANADFIVSYGESGDVYADEVTLGADGIGLTIEGNGVDFEVQSQLVGAVNVPNLEMLVATLLGLSTPLEEIQNIVAAVRPAPGRMELYRSQGMPSVVVDYAHTPDALEKALLSVRKHCQGSLWCVFGCGGDRDREKRPVMGRAADQFADRLIVTNDNPRSENGQAIADEIVTGIDGQYQIVLDRAAAIRQAIEQADVNDWVLVAGKGHETTQQIGQEYLPFSDREQVAQVMGVAA